MTIESEGRGYKSTKYAAVVILVETSVHFVGYISLGQHKGVQVGWASRNIECFGCQGRYLTCFLKSQL